MSIINRMLSRFGVDANIIIIFGVNGPEVAFCPSACLLFQPAVITNP